MLSPVNKLDKPLSFRVSIEMADRLDKLSKETGRPKSYYIAEAVNEYLADLEDYYLAEKRYAEIVAGRSNTYTVAEVERHLGLGS